MKDLEEELTCRELIGELGGNLTDSEKQTAFEAVEKYLEDAEKPKKSGTIPYEYKTNIQEVVQDVMELSKEGRFLYNLVQGMTFQDVSDVEKSYGKDAWIDKDSKVRPTVQQVSQPSMITQTPGGLLSRRKHKLPEVSPATSQVTTTTTLAGMMSTEGNIGSIIAVGSLGAAIMDTGVNSDSIGENSGKGGGKPQSLFTSQITSSAGSQSISQ